MEKHRYRRLYKSKFKSITDKEQLRKKIDAATVEYLKNNKITHLPNSPDNKVSSVRVKDLTEISNTEEFYYLEEQIENNSI